MVHKSEPGALDVLPGLDHAFFAIKRQPNNFDVFRAQIFGQIKPAPDTTAAITTSIGPAHDHHHTLEEKSPGQPSTVVTLGPGPGGVGPPP